MPPSGDGYAQASTVPVVGARHPNLLDLLVGAVVLPAVHAAVTVAVDLDPDDARAVHVAPGVGLPVPLRVQGHHRQLPGLLVVDRFRPALGSSRLVGATRAARAERAGREGGGQCQNGEPHALYGQLRPVTYRGGSLGRTAARALVSAAGRALGGRETRRLGSILHIRKGVSREIRGEKELIQGSRGLRGQSETSMSVGTYAVSRRLRRQSELTRSVGDLRCQSGTVRGQSETSRSVDLAGRMAMAAATAKRTAMPGIWRLNSTTS